MESEKDRVVREASTLIAESYGREVAKSYRKVAEVATEEQAIILCEELLKEMLGSERAVRELERKHIIRKGAVAG